MILDYNSIIPNDFEEVFQTRMKNHINLVNMYYHKITGKKLLNHDSDKFDNPIWKYYYYSREKKCKLSDELVNQWIIADMNHRFNSHHHIECLTNGLSLDWNELCADFFAVNKKHNNSKEQLIKNVTDNYGYALFEIKDRLNFY